MATETFGEKVIKFNTKLNFTNELSDGFRVINPFTDNPETIRVMSEFYDKYYHDDRKRKFIIGINPGRFGAAVTGVPFTDTKHLESECGISMKSVQTHEVSSGFVYDMIDAYGGLTPFYRDIYINSLFPLAIVRQNSSGKWVNANYYDDAAIFRMTEDFIIECLRKQIGFGLDTDEVFVMGKKNADFVRKINQRTGMFGSLTILEHPRYIQQYKAKEKQLFIDKYIRALKK